MVHAFSTSLCLIQRQQTYHAEEQDTANPSREKCEEPSRKETPRRTGGRTWDSRLCPRRARGVVPVRSREELPRIDNYRKYRALASGRATERLWRITCFVVDRKVRRRGIARAALRAALAAIRKKGGGLPDHLLESGNLRKRVDAWHRVDVREGGVQHRRPFWRDQIPDKCVSAKERLSVVRLERGLSRSLSSGARSQIYPGLAEGLYQILTVVLFTEDGVLVHAAMRGWARCGCSGMCFSWSRS